MVFRVPFSYPCYKSDIFNFKLLVIIFISQDNPFIHPSILLTSREKTAPYKSFFPPTACFIMPVLFTSAQLPNLIHLLGLFLPWDMKSECVAKLSEKVVNLKGNQPWIFTEGLMLKLKFQYFGPLDEKSWLIGKDPDAGKDWRQEEKGTTEDETVGCHHLLDGHEFEKTPEDGEGQGSLMW